MTLEERLEKEGVISNELSKRIQNTWIALSKMEKEYFDKLTRVICDLYQENEQLKKENKRLKKEMEDRIAERDNITENYKNILSSYSDENRRLRNLVAEAERRYML